MKSFLHLLALVFIFSGSSAHAETLSYEGIFLIHPVMLTYEFSKDLTLTRSYIPCQDPVTDQSCRGPGTWAFFIVGGKASIAYSGPSVQDDSVSPSASYNSAEIRLAYYVSEKDLPSGILEGKVNFTDNTHVVLGRIAGTYQLSTAQAGEQVEVTLEKNEVKDFRFAEHRFLMWSDLTNAKSFGNIPLSR